MRHGSGTAGALLTGCHGVLLAAAPGPAGPASGAVVSQEARAGVTAKAPPVHAEDPPPAHTGGFGEPTCHACHSEYPLGMDGDVRVEGLPDPYEPGASYDLVVHLRSAGMERAGFQASIRILEGREAGAPAGEITPLDDRVVVRDDRNGAGLYVQHAPGAAWTDGEETVTWTFTWTAPGRGGQPVVLHLAANSADGDESPFGDIVYTVEKISRSAVGTR